MQLKTWKRFLAFALVTILFISASPAYADEPMQNENETQIEQSVPDDQVSDPTLGDALDDDGSTGVSSVTNDDAATEDEADDNGYTLAPLLDGTSEEDEAFDDESPVRHPTPIVEGRYVIRSSLSDTRVIDITGGSLISEANVQLFSSNMTPAQQFDFSYDDEGFYTIKNVKSGCVLDVCGGQAVAGTNVWQYRPNGTPAQKWIATDLGNGTYRFTSALSDSLVLDVTGGQDADHANIWIWNLNNTKAQAFYLVSLAPKAPSERTIADGRYIIYSSLNSSLVIDVPGSSWDYGMQMQLWNANGTIAQIFDIRYQTNGYYVIRSLNSGLALDVSFNNVVASSKLHQWDFNNSDAQHWAIQQNADGSFTFLSKTGRLALDVCGGNSNAGAGIWMWYPNQTPAQKFILKPLSADALKEGIYNIVPMMARGKCIDIAGGSTSSGANAQAFANNGTLAQKFQIYRIEDSVYSIQSIVSGHYLTAGGGNVYQSALAANTLTANQKWTAQWVFGGFSLINVGTNQAMTVTAGGMDGHDIRLAAFSGFENQAFRLFDTPPLAMGTYVVSAYSGKVIDSTGGMVSPGTNTQLWVPNGTPAQKWQLTAGTGEYFSIRCVRSLRALGIEGNARYNGANVQLMDYNGSDGQLWRAVPSGDGWFYIQSKTGLYLSGTGAADYDGSNVMVVTANNTNAQKFRFAPTSYTGPTGTYIDVNLTTQRMYYVRDGVILLESNVVTGRVSAGWYTPTGTFYIMSKASPAVLIGPSWYTPVTYWMQVTPGGVGFHDANWQPTFGGNWYYYNGSRGCINLPYWAAAELYRLVSVGTTVYIHY
ncbi:MAG: RICIN domain-containing protein [Coriobacteriia bacterium]|nr:RICIN domain-containing protein [Coriobacteriia bacterium]